jgi:phosphatidylglycerol lysyltransferase
VALSKEKINHIFHNVRSFSLIFDIYKQKSQTQKMIDHTLYSENQLNAREIISKHGQEALDYFKVKEDKATYIYKNTLIAYKICNKDVVVLGDPVGPKEELAEAIYEFDNFCEEHGWKLSFFQCSNRCLDDFKWAGFENIKIGSEAIVDIENFDLVGPKKKDFRNRIRKLEKLGYFTKTYNGNISDEFFAKLQIISNEWLDEPNRVERGFSLGYFCRKYIEESEILTVENDLGEIVAFVNLIPSYKDGQVTIDLMRKSKSAPSGVMDYIFVKAILELKEKGYKSLSLGLAPMSGFQDGEQVSFAELAVHSIFKKLNFLFNYEGLKVFKDKFATSWEPKFLSFKNIPQLARLALSIKSILEDVDC